MSLNSELYFSSSRLLMLHSNPKTKIPSNLMTTAYKLKIKVESYAYSKKWFELASVNNCENIFDAQTK